MVDNPPLVLVDVHAAVGECPEIAGIAVGKAGVSETIACRICRWDRLGHYMKSWEDVPGFMNHH